MKKFFGFGNKKKRTPEEELIRAVKKVKLPAVRNILENHPELTIESLKKAREAVIWNPNCLQTRGILERIDQVLKKKKRPTQLKMTKKRDRDNPDVILAEYFELIKQNKLQGITDALSQNERLLDMKTTQEETLLSQAIRRGRAKIVQSLLKAGAKIDVNKKTRSTSLHTAATVGRGDIPKLLLMYKADVDAINVDGDTPLHIAATKGHVKVAKALISKGALFQYNGDGNSPLHIACLNGHQQFVEYLLSVLGIKNTISNQNRDGKTAIDLANSKGHSNIELMLLRSRSDVEQENMKAGDHEEVFLAPVESDEEFDVPEDEEKKLSPYVEKPSGLNDQKAFFNFLKDYLHNSKILDETEMPEYDIWIEDSTVGAQVRGKSTRKVDNALKKYHAVMATTKLILKNSRILVRDNVAAGSQNQIGFAFPEFDKFTFGVGRFSVVESCLIFKADPSDLKARNWQNATWDNSLDAQLVAKELMQSTPDVSGLYRDGKGEEARSLTYLDTLSLLQNLTLASYRETLGKKKHDIYDGDVWEWDTVVDSLETEKNMDTLEFFFGVTYQYNAQAEDILDFMMDNSENKDKSTYRTIHTPIKWLIFFRELIQKRSHILFKLSSYIERWQEEFADVAHVEINQQRHDAFSAFKEIVESEILFVDSFLKFLPSVHDLKSLKDGKPNLRIEEEEEEESGEEDFAPPDFE